MIYSRVLHVEYEHPNNDEGDGAYTLFSLIQPLQMNRKPTKDVMAQYLAVLWAGLPDTRLIALIEKALISGVLAPVKLLHASEGNLCVVYSGHLREIDYAWFEDAWTDLALGVWYDEWIAEFFREDSLSGVQNGGRLFRHFASEILTKHNLGITPFTDEMFLFHEEWAPDNFFPAGSNLEGDEQYGASAVFDECADLNAQSTDQNPSSKK